MIFPFKNSIKQFLFHLNRKFASIYYFFIINRNPILDNNGFRILFVVDDIGEKDLNSRRLRSFISLKKRNPNIDLIYLSKLETGRHLNLSSYLNSVKENFDFFWLDTKACVPIKNFALPQNENNFAKGDSISYDTFNSSLNRPFFKPEFSIDMFLDLDYLEGGVLFSVEVLSFLGDKRDFGLKEIYIDLILSIYSRGNRLIHSKRIGFICDKLPRRSSIYQNNILSIYNSKAFPTKMHSIEEVNGKAFFQYKIKKPFVSIVIPFRDKVDLLKVAVESIFQKSKYEKFEILLVSNQSKEPETLDYLAKLKKEKNNIAVIEYDHVFNFSAINNFAANLAKGEALLFLNNDTKIITNNFLEIMTSYAMNESIGGVGPKLLFEDHLIQHAGIILGLTGLAEHAFKEMKDDDRIDSYGSVQWTRNYLALTAAALMVEKKKFTQVGGFNEKLVVCGNDVNLGIKLFEAGFRNVYLPQVELYHYESKSRKGTPIPIGDFKESILSYSKYLEQGDPFFHPRLSLTLPWFSYNYSTIPSHFKNLKFIKKMMPEIFPN